MSASPRTFCLGSDDIVYVLPRTRYQAMLGDPAAHPIPRFANQSVRCADVFVELEGRKVVRAPGLNPYILEFDRHGVFVEDALLRVIFARQALMHPRPAAVEAADRAVASEGRWTPSAALASLIFETALGTRMSRRL
jgi:hypothetical protein